MVRTAIFSLVCLATVSVTSRLSAAERPKLPANRIAVIYFHRTQRCPTCLKMGSYSEEAVKQAFAAQLKQGTVQFYLINFQNPKFAKVAKGYRVEGPALIVAKIVNNKVAGFKNLDEIWMKAADKKAFLQYVQKNVSAYYKTLQKEQAEKSNG